LQQTGVVSGQRRSHTESTLKGEPVAGIHSASPAVSSNAAGDMVVSVINDDDGRSTLLAFDNNFERAVMEPHL